MSAVLPLPAGATAQPCFHCGEPADGRAPWRVRFRGSERPLCCAGCEAVARTILDAGLDDYYGQRERARVANPGRKIGGEDERIRAALERAAHVEPVEGAGHSEARFLVEGITCAACAWLAERALRRVAGVVSAEVNCITHVATVRWDARTSLAAMCAALAKVGLGLSPLAGSAHERARARRRDALELGVAALSMMQAMMFTVPLYLAEAGDLEPAERQFLNVAAMLVTLPALLFSARRFFVGAWRDLASRRITMDVPVAVALAALFGSGAAALLAGGGAAYFDSIGMFLTLLLTARWFESGLRHAAQDQIERMADAMPPHAKVLRDYPASTAATHVASRAIVAGDVIEVGEGECVVADAVTLETPSRWNEAVLSGEAAPLTRPAGATVPAGAINAGAPIRLRVLRSVEASTLARIAALTARLLAERQAILPMHDRLAAWIAPASLGLASLGAAWGFVDASRSFDVAVSVLAITCPCALALAAPSVAAGAHLALARRGWLMARPHALAEAAALTHVVFDKTGTLTDGRLGLEHIETFTPLDAGECLALAAGLESGANHPLAAALCEAASARGIEPLPFHDRESKAGKGVGGHLDGQHYRIGTRPYACGGGDAGDRPGVWLARGGELLACFTFADRLRADARDALASLRAMGLKVSLASGDDPSSVAAVAAALGLARSDAHARLTPDEKAGLIAHLQADGERVALVGDGFNDAPAMAQADFSMALAAGADLARNSAGAVLRGTRLAAVPELIGLSRKAARLSRQNLVWALTYNALAIPAALMDWVAPAHAAIGMAVSSLIVVANAMRIARRRTPAWTGC